MAIANEVVLRHGLSMPILGIGTTHNGGYNHETVMYAVEECGVRLIDTAKRYGTESFIGQGVLDSGIDRSEFFLTTKLWPADYGGGAKTRAAFQGSADRLQSEYIDLYMMHWPDTPDYVVNKRQCLEDTWRELELLLDEEKCRAIGVSNFLQPHLESLMETASVVPHVNQVEFHPYQNPKELRQFCDRHKIQFEGYCPLAKGRILTEPTIMALASDLAITPAQLLLRWSVQNGVVTIPKSNKKHRVRENCQVLSSEFELPISVFERLNGIVESTGTTHRIINLDRCQRTINSDLPDGYKLCQAQGTNLFPHLDRVKQHISRMTKPGTRKALRTLA